MSIPYNLGIPTAGHNPSVDQPNMAINNDNIDAYVAVDHVGFNTLGSGQHEQVTFNSNNDPGGGTITPPILFTNSFDGAGNALPSSLAELFFYTGAATQAKNQYVSQANGSVLLFGGIILKWGTSATIGGGGASFTPAFPNACFSVIVVGSSSLYTGGFTVTAKSASGFTVVRTDGHSGSTGYYYIAIGN
jgi:hypothetical protein